MFLASGYRYTHSIDLVLSVLIDPEPGIDTANTTSPISICRLWRMGGHERYNLGVKVVKERGIGQPNEVSS
jgi:hypothetical protein